MIVDDMMNVESILDFKNVIRPEKNIPDNEDLVNKNYIFFRRRTFRSFFELFNRKQGTKDSKMEYPESNGLASNIPEWKIRKSS